ncbi:MAG: hypothetical protein MUO19_07180, partial [Dehalococcoidales bacterium]|nr:hypothetical protein [Dehalococcoidales bacterium]
MTTEQETVATTEQETGEVELLRNENEALARQVEDRAAAVARLEEALAARNNDLTVFQEALETSKRETEEQAVELAGAVAAYLELVVEANPGVLAELVTGDTIKAVNESLARARALMERVRQELEAEAARTRVPAGA